MSTTVTMNARECILQNVAEAWEERLMTSCRDGKDPDDALIREWRQQTLTQVNTLYGMYHHTVSEEDIQKCIDETMLACKDLPPQPTNSAATSFSLFSSLGDGAGGLSAFFSWPLTAEKADDEIWQALTEVEYLDDVYPDWTAEIQPWIRARLSLSSCSSACHLFRRWYGKARRQESPETAQITVGMMELIFQTLNDDSQNTETRKALLEVGLDMVVDYMVRKATCPPMFCLECLWRVSFTVPLMYEMTSKDPRGRWLRLALHTHPWLYRSLGTTLDISLLANVWNYQQEETSSTSLEPHRRYALALLANILVMVRVNGFPWDAWQSANGAEVYSLLWMAVCDSKLSHRDLYAEGLEALLAGSDEKVLAKFRQDLLAFSQQHGGVPDGLLQPLYRFARV